jgi:hypothetical protein
MVGWALSIGLIDLPFSHWTHVTFKHCAPVGRQAHIPPHPTAGWPQAGAVALHERYRDVLGATCPTRAIAKCTRRDTQCGSLRSPPQRMLRRGECGARAARNVPDSRALLSAGGMTHCAATRRCLAAHVFTVGDGHLLLAIAVCNKGNSNPAKFLT